MCLLFIFPQVVKLDSLAIYLNSNSKMYAEESMVSITNYLKETISAEDNVIADFNYGKMNKK